MPKQTIELCVPEGYELTGDYRKLNNGNSYLARGRAYVWTLDVVSDHEYPILRKVAPVRESRWRFVPTMHGSPCYSYLYPTLVDARKALGCNHNGVYTHIERLDFENNKLVAVTLEPQ